MKVDLHCHSDNSDGKWTVPALVEEAERKGVQLFAVTDHDNLMGSKLALEMDGKFSGRLVAGIEISTEVLERKVHLLAFFPEIQGDTISELEEVLQKIRTSREDRMKVMIQKANENGFKITFQEVLEEAGREGASTDVLSRPHIGRVLVRKGYVKDLDEAFTKYIREGKPLYAPRFSLDFRSWISLIHRCEGLVIWAHPLFEQDEEVEKLREMADLLLREGIDGVEVVYSYTRRAKLSAEYIEKGTEFLKKFVRKNDLLITAGGDFHGDSGILGELELTAEDVERFLNALGVT